jgi:hypothetical protein
MKLKKRLAGVGLAAALLAGNAVASQFDANLFYNGGFEMDPILSEGQTAPGEGETKLTETDPNNEWYPIAISGMPYWNYSFDQGEFDGYTGTDIGMGYALSLGDGNMGRVLNINRWDRRVSQTAAGVVIEAGYRYTLTARCYLPLDDAGDFKVGTLSLYAGTPGNPDDFVLLNQLGYAHAISPGASDAYGGDRSFLINSAGWVDLSISYVAATDDVNLGQGLTACMVTESGSLGATYWDNVTLTATPVPEPASISLGFAVLALVCRRRRRK